MPRTSFSVLLAVLVLGASLALTACSGKPSRSDYLKMNKSLSPERILFTDETDVIVSDMRIDPDGPFYRVQLEFMNSTAKEETHPVYRIEWLDKNGLMKSQSSWKPLAIRDDQRIRVTEMADVPGVTDFRLTISSKEAERKKANKE